MISSNAGSRFGVLRHYSTGDIVFGSSSKNFFLFWSKASLNTSFFVPKKSPHGDEFRFSAPSYLMSSMSRSSSTDFVLEQVFETDNKIIISQRRRRNYSMPKVDDSSIASNNFSKRISGEG